MAFKKCCSRISKSNHCICDLCKASTSKKLNDLLVKKRKSISNEKETISKVANLSFIEIFARVFGTMPPFSQKFTIELYSKGKDKYLKP